MTDSDKKQFASLMTSICELYNKQVSKSLMLMYFGALGEYSIDEVTRGFEKHTMDTKQGSFMPKPADIARKISAAELTPKELEDLLNSKDWAIGIDNVL